MCSYGMRLQDRGNWKTTKVEKENKNNILHSKSDQMAGGWCKGFFVLI